MYKEYLNELGSIPLFLKKYLKCPSLLRLKNIGYFCGMDYASKDIYNFLEHISRYDHSLDVALLTYKYSKDKKAAIAGLFHDVATPCFAHVIDYMNKDYVNQESTEELTGEIIKNDEYLLKCLKKDQIDVEDIIDFKKYSIVDNNRPKLCADRLDGVILTGMFWTRNILIPDSKEILKYIDVYNNEDNEKEIGFSDLDIAIKVKEASDNIDVYCHSIEDNFMMELLANITRYAIDNNYVKYEELFYLNEDDIHKIFKSITDKKFIKMYDTFKNVKMENIEFQEMPYIKKRELKPLYNGKRLK